MTTVLLTVTEARAALRMGRNGFYGLIRRREISVVRIGGRTLVPESEVQRLIECRTIPARRSFFGSHRVPASVRTI